MANNQVLPPTSVCHPSNPMVMGGPPISGPITTNPTISNSALANSSVSVPTSEIMPGSRPSILSPPYSTPNYSAVMNQMSYRTSPAIPVSSGAATMGISVRIFSQSTPCCMVNTSSAENFYPPSSQPDTITTTANTPLCEKVMSSLYVHEEEPKSPAAQSPNESSNSNEAGNSKGAKLGNTSATTIRSAPTSPKPDIVVCPPAPKDRHPLFTPDELRHHLVPILEKLYQQDPGSSPFCQPVDIIKTPINLCTVQSKLHTGQYTDPWDFVDDIRLMFDNAWRYNRKTSCVYRYCTKVSGDEILLAIYDRFFFALSIYNNFHFINSRAYDAYVRQNGSLRNIT